MSDTLVTAEGVSKKFCRNLKRSLWYGMRDLGRELVGLPHGGNGYLRRDEFWAVKDVTFELRRGECLGLIGQNGAGKTTLLKLLNGQIKPDHGRIEIHGRVGALIALGAGFNPVLTGRENIYINAAVLGLGKKETDSRFDEIVDFSGLEDFIDSPVQNYSSGMVVRLGFSIAATLQPDVLIIDEVLAVGDSAFRIKCYNRIMGLRDRMAMIFVSHSMPQLSKVCTSGLVLAPGESRPPVRSVPDSILAYFENLPPATVICEGQHSSSIEAIRVDQDDLSYSATSPWPSSSRCVGDLVSDTKVGLTVTLSSIPGATSILALWSVTDIDQRLIAQTASNVVKCPTAWDRLSIVTQIDALNLNSGRYTLSVHLMTSSDGEWGESLAGLRDVLSFSVRSDVFKGAACILYPAKSIAAKVTE